jgi:putative copper export protein/mono/diheme cytochrome c family protein
MSETLLVAARFVHFASTIVLVGCLCFAAMIAPTRWLDAAWRRVAWAALPIIALSGALWFVAQAARMSDSPIADALRPELLSTVLWHTQFGPVFALRLGLCAILALAFFWRTGPARWVALVLSALLLASLAWVGHAVGEKGRDHLIHLAADIVHLLAAGAWLGGLPMLALLFHRALAAATADAYDVARDATRRFSVMGLIAVAALLATGIVNTWYLAGSLPALVGTDYGRWLLLKIALFVAMVATAAVNRQVLTPRLALKSKDPIRPKARMALLKLRRNSLAEAALGLGVIAIVAWLGSAVPGAHQQAEWPFPVRYNSAAFTVPEFRTGLWLAIAAIVLALGLATAAFVLRRWRVGLAAAALVIVPFALPRFGVLVTSAHPTSFFNSPTGYTAHSVSVGARAFAQNCVACHGPEGKGDGPLARSLPVRPADLTAAHIYAHLPGDLYWTIGQGVPGTPMPAFLATLDAQTRWSLIDFILANADGMRAKGGTPAQVPDFAIECPGGAGSSLRASAGHIVDLVFGDSSVAARIAALTSRGLGADVTVVTATDVPPPAGACAARAHDLAVTLALYLPDRAKRIAGSEFLIDGKGWLRDAWPSPPDAATLRRAVTIARTMPITVSPRPTGHVH